MEIKTDYDKKVEKSIKKVKAGIAELKAEGFKIEVEKDVETMLGNKVEHIYVRDYLKSGKVILQKHLFTI